MEYIIYTILLIPIIYFILTRKSKLSPLFIFNLIWFVTLFLYNFKLSYIQLDITNKTYQVFLYSILAFNITYIFLNILFMKFKIKKKKIITNTKMINLMYYLAIILFLIEVIYSGGVPFLWKLTGSTKIYFDFGISSIHGALNGLIIILGSYFIYKKDKKALFLVFIGILIISRQLILSMIIETIIVFIIFNKGKLKLSKKGITIIILAFLMFTVLGNFRSGNDVMDNVFKAKENYEKVPVSLKWVYSYTTFSISNVNNLINMTDGGFNKGASIINSVVPTIITNKIGVVEEQKINYLVSPNYNASTYLVEPYLDFGMMGIIIFNIFIAALGFILYRDLIINNNDKFAFIYAIYLHNIIIMFFTNMFIYLPIIIQFIYVQFMFRKDKNNEN